MHHDTFFGNNTVILVLKIKRLRNKQLDNFVKNQGNRRCITERIHFGRMSTIAHLVQSDTMICQTGYAHTMSLSFESLFQLLGHSFQLLWLRRRSVEARLLK